MTASDELQAVRHKSVAGRRFTCGLQRAAWSEHP